MKGVVEELACMLAWIALFAVLVACYASQCSRAERELAAAIPKLVSSSLERVAESLPEGSEVELEIPEFELAEETLRVEISGRAYALREGADVEVRGGGGEIALVGEQG